ncbi:DNA internalization-related competence protein ComEC/Rec2 [Desulfolutivibrio sulfoxidireducens]|uniref:DNA internalization-related competence protein ComEC/Rec2 n=1 Tax=Desulfolutivibrio sulfoxidireducens TaxID=2773299 RepID=UPI00159E031C|nr:DNA internalization-related competence protein ComEC/Rec2 [Desulfolutivibrio sulfoxidireducens]QLA15311.1 DNA internalization-related competence protein ComEC/Rec2 [Desulfolutivibrio sulfoxidireducens]
MQRSPPPPLLPWQILLVCAACGILAVRVPVGAGAACLAVALLAAVTGSKRGCLALVPVAFGLGLGAAWLALPAPPTRLAAVVLTGKKIALTGRVASVDALPDNRLTVILDEVRHEPAASDPDGPAAGGRLPGRLALAWDLPAWRPSPGDVLGLSARVRPVGGFKNPGGYDAAFARRTQGIFVRAYARGDAVRLIEASDSPFRGLRESLRQGIVSAVPRLPATGDGVADRPPGRGRDQRVPDEPQAGKTGHPAPDDPPASGDAPDAPDRAQRIPNQPPAGIRPFTDAPPPPDAERLAPEPRPTPGGAMLLALLTGDRSLLTNTDMDLVRRASLAHALALSGMHVGYVAAIGWLLAHLAGRIRPRIFLRLPRHKLSVALAAPLVLGYVWVGGFSPTLVRATLMFGCFGLLILLDKKRVVLDGLFLALAVILAVSPLAALNLSLELSVLAVAGLAVFWPLGRAIFERLPVPPRLRPAAFWLFSIFWTSLSAEAAILPLLALEFGEISPHAYLNAVWLPVLGLVVMPLGLAGLLTSLVWPEAAALFYVPAAYACDALMGMLSWQDGLGLLGTITVLRPLWPEIVGYFVLLAGLALWWRAPGADRPSRRAVLALGLALLMVPAVRQGLLDLSDRVTLTMLDVGQGQALVVEVPGGRRILVDGGGGTFGTFDMGRAVTGPALAYGRSPELWGMILTHGHADHAQGLTWPLSRFDVGFFGQSASPDAGEPDAALTSALAASGPRPRVLAAGDRLDFGNGIRLEVLHPPAGHRGKANDASVVLRLVGNGRGLALLCGDIEKKAIRALLASGRDLTAEVLVLPHHGSASSLSRAFYRAVKPQAAFISCGEYNRFRYPSGKVLAELSRLRCPVHVTAARGAVTAVWSDDDPARITAFVPAPAGPVSLPGQ